MDGSMDVSSYQEQLQKFRQSDKERDELVTSILREYEALKIAYTEKCDDHSNEVNSRRFWQKKAESSENALTSYKKADDSSPFVAVLIDGDGAVFQDYLLAQGRDGGGEAAHQLLTNIRDYLRAAYPDSNTSSWSVVVTVILNMPGLSSKLYSCKIISSNNELADFGRAFGLTNPLFNFADVGSGKERADHKIRETLRLYIGNRQCRHIFFGPCHDNGYLPVLEQYKRDPAISSKFTLIETTPAEAGFIDLGFKRVHFDRVFRSEPLPARPLTTMPPPGFESTSSPIMSRAIPVPTRTVSGLGSSADAAPFVPNKSGSPSPAAELGAASSWATVGKTNGNGKTINIAPKKTVKKRGILLNAWDERIDEELPRLDIAAKARFDDRVRKGGKFCNNYHLNGTCHSGSYCEYQHGECLSPGERLMLVFKARSLPCPKGSTCRDFDCNSGHHCLFGKGCTMDHQCRFYDYHGIVAEPVKKYFDDGTEEWLTAHFDKKEKSR